MLKRLALPVTTFLLLAGCATAVKPMLVAPSNPGQPALRLAGNKVLVIAPNVVYRDVRTERVISSADQPLSETISKNILSLAEAPLIRNHLEMIRAEDLEATLQEESKRFLEELSQQSGVLVRPRSKRRAELLGQLQTLKAAKGVDAVLVHTVDVKMGSAATHDYGNTGNMTAGTSTTDIRAGLIETSTGELVWNREVYHRDKLGPNNIDELFDLLYADFSVEASASRKKGEANES